VDDESTNRELLEVMLSSEGHLLVSAASGEEALAVVALEPPDVILLDIMMPGMDGHKVAAKLKGNPATKNIPIIMITALDSRYDRILGLSAGAEEFLTKPVDRVELCVRVRNLLRLKAYGDFYDKYSQTLEAEVSERMRLIHLIVIVLLAAWASPAVGQSHGRPGRTNQQPRSAALVARAPVAGDLSGTGGRVGLGPGQQYADMGRHDV